MTFVELCCGSAAVSLALLGGPRVKPPIAYMGSKRGYAHAILAALGLRRGQGADRVLLVDAGPWGRVWQALSDPATGLAVAERIRSWADEDPRALWDRLRADGVPDGADAAAWLASSATSYGADPHRGFKATAGGTWPDDPPDIRSTATATATATLALAGGVSVEAAAAWALVQHWSFSGRGSDKGYGGPGCPGGLWGQEKRDASLSPQRLADGVDAAAVAVRVASARCCDVRTVEPIPGAVVYIDPPYAGTTGYGADLPRAEVLALARRWSDAGCVVCVSEAEPLPLDGWHSFRIDHARVGQKRTFSRQQEEWITMNRPPTSVPPKQESLW